MTHHIFCGDCAADHARPFLTPRRSAPEVTPRRSAPEATPRRSAPEGARGTHELAGTVHVWKDSSAVGPCSIDPALHRRLRSAWWHVALAEIQQPADFPRPFVAWFGPDPWEQVALLELLAGAGRPASFIPLDCNVTDIDEDDFPAYFAARRPAPDPLVLGRLWTDFCADDPARDSGLLALARSLPLPHLASALGRVLADRRDHLTERRVRDLVAAGTHDLPRLMRALAALEAPQHGAWYGDAIVARLRDAALDA